MDAGLNIGLYNSIVLCEKWTGQNDTSLGQRKNQSSL